MTRQAINQIDLVTGINHGLAEGFFSSFSEALKKYGLTKTEYVNYVEYLQSTGHQIQDLSKFPHVNIEPVRCHYPYPVQWLQTINRDYLEGVKETFEAACERHGYTKKRYRESIAYLRKWATFCPPDCSRPKRHLPSQPPEDFNW